MKKIVIFASGSGSNAENIVRYCQKQEVAAVAGIFTNHATAPVLERAHKLSVPTFVFSKEELYGAAVLEILANLQPDLIVLAGFLLKFPQHILNKYVNKVINIHPALLPKYGGKGMYGMNVHRAVLQNHDAETGITIHYVNENYDEGQIIFQTKVDVSDCKTAESLASRVHALEMKYFPAVVQSLLA